MELLELTDQDVRDMLLAVGVTPTDAAGELSASFEDMGLDSLARIQIASRVMDRFGLDIEERLTPDVTPAGMRELVNQQLTAVNG